MKRIYVTRNIVESGLELLCGHFEVTVQPHDRPATREELMEAASRSDGMLTMLCDRIDHELMSSAPNLKAVANYAVGYDNIDLEAAKKLGIGVSNTPDVLTNATAELAWALLFAAARMIVPSDVLMRTGSWSGWAPLQFVGSDVSGKTLGIIGAGRIGSTMGAMSRGFGMKVLYWNRSVSERLERETGARKVELEELLRSSDFISLHVPLKDETRHLIGERELAMMKRSAILVNTARGPVVDEAALVQALKSGTIAAAGLDVYEREPEMHPGLAELRNVVVTPHTGSGTVGAREAMARMAAENLIAMLSGRPGPQCLNPEIY